MAMADCMTPERAATAFNTSGSERCIRPKIIIAHATHGSTAVGQTRRLFVFLEFVTTTHTVILYYNTVYFLTSPFIELIIMTSWCLLVKVNGNVFSTPYILKLSDSRNLQTALLIYSIASWRFPLVSSVTYWSIARSACISNEPTDESEHHMHNSFNTVYPRRSIRNISAKVTMWNLLSDLPGPRWNKSLFNITHRFQSREPVRGESRTI